MLQQIIFNLSTTSWLDLEIPGTALAQLSFLQLSFSAVGVGKEHAKASFDAIDINHDGSISQDEFVNAAVEFYNNTDPVHPSTIFFGLLVD